MVDPQKHETLLARRFPGSTGQQIAAAANAIVALVGEHEATAQVRRKPGVRVSVVEGDGHERICSR
jgi:outer membrane lipoprotein SlyB